VDRNGQTVDFRLSPKRDVAAAKAFFRKALRTRGRAPISITLDGYAASHRAVREMSAENRALKDTKLRSSKSVTELLSELLIEQTKSRPRQSNDNGLVETKN
jgi:transposase-like protein